MGVLLTFRTRGEVELVARISAADAAIKECDGLATGLMPSRGRR